MASQSQITELVSWRTQVLTNHLLHHQPSQQQQQQQQQPSLSFPSICLQYSPPELSEPQSDFDTKDMRKILDGHNIVDRDWLYGLMIKSNLFCPRKMGGRVFIAPDYNQSMEQQRAMTVKRIEYLLESGVFEGWLTDGGLDSEMRKFAFYEVCAMYDHALGVKLGVHFSLW